MTALLFAAIVAATPATSTSFAAGPLLVIPPQIGITVSDTGTIGAVIAFPWTFKLVSEHDALFRPALVLLEPAFFIRSKTVFHLRGAFRWLYQTLPWVALGGGLGFGAEFGELVQPDSSLEFVVRIGPGPTGFGMLAARMDSRLDGTTAWVLTVGGVYW